MSVEPTPQETPRYGGYTVVARALSDAQRDSRPQGFRRQQIHVWWLRRDRNDFPDKHQVVVAGKSKDLFLVEEVLKWYTGYVPKTGGKRSARGSLTPSETTLTHPVDD